MADEKLIMDIAFGRVDASAITKALTSEFGKVFESAKVSLGGATGGEGKGGSGKGGGGDILAVLELIFGALIQDLAKIINALISVSTILLAVSLIIKILADTVGAFWAGFRNVTKVWDAIFQLISKLVEPFVNLLIPLLIPVLHLLAIMARIVNAVMMPIFSLLMKAFTPKGDTMQTAFKQIMAGDLVGGMLTILKGVTESFMGLKDQIVSKVMVAFDLVKNWLLSFLTIDLSVIHDIINNIFGKDLGGVLNLLIDTIYNTISALIGFVAQIAGKANFDKLFGEGKFDEIKSKNQGFAGGADVAKAMQDFIQGIISFAVELVKFTQDNWPKLTAIISEITTNIFPQLASAIYEFLQTTWKNWYNIVQTQIIPIIGSLYVAINNFLIETWPPLITALDSLTKMINEWNKIDFKSIIEQAAKGILDIGTGGNADNLKNLLHPQTEGDFLMRPGQSAISFSPNDTIIGVKDTSILGGNKSGTIVNNYYINGNGDQFLESKIKEVVRGSESNLSRYGYYQKGR